MIGITLLIGAVIAIAGSWFTLQADHIKTGVSVIALGVIAIVAGLVTFFSRSSAEEEQLADILI